MSNSFPYKKFNLTFFFIFISIFLYTSCNWRHTNHHLVLAEKILENNPDSCIKLLNLIDVDKLDKNQFAAYTLFHTISRDKLSQNIKNDTLIYTLPSHFEKTKNNRKAAWANLYAGKVTFLNDHYHETNSHLLKAEEFAKKANDYNLLGIILSEQGFMYQKELNIIQAKNCYISSQQYFRQAGNEKDEKYVYNQIAYLFLLQEDEQPDSAIFYYQKALNYAKANNDSLKMSNIYRNIAIAHVEAEEFAIAKRFVRKAISINNSEKFAFGNYSLMSNICLWNNEVDSAIYYVANFLSDDARNHLDKHMYHTMLYRINKQIGQHNKALENHELMYKYAEIIFKENLEHSMAEISKKYHSEKIQNAYNKIVIHRQYLIILLIFTFLLCLSLGYFFFSSVKKKKREITEAEENIEMLKGMLLKENSPIKEILLQRLNIARKVTQIELLPHKKNDKEFLKRYNEIFKDDLKDLLLWENLMPVFEDLYKDFIHTINSTYPELADKDKIICCLIHAGFSIPEVAFITSYTYDSFRVYKVKLRKKMGFDSNGDFMNFLRE